MKRLAVLAVLAVSVLVVGHATPYPKEKERFSACIMPVHGSWSGQKLGKFQVGDFPAQPGEFFGNLHLTVMSNNPQMPMPPELWVKTSGSIDGYLAVDCSLPGAVKRTWEKHFWGWQEVTGIEKAGEK